MGLYIVAGSAPIWFGLVHTRKKCTKLRKKNGKRERRSFPKNKDTERAKDTHERL
jgi:hypothetical protein